MTKVQFHWQNMDDPKQTKFVDQGEFNDLESYWKWIGEVINIHRAEMPEGWRPMVCDETSSMFALTPELGQA